MIQVVEEQGTFFLELPNEQMLQFLKSKYQNALPFSHIVIDNFLSPFFIDKIINNFPQKKEASISHNSKTQHLKRGYRPHQLENHPSSHYLSILNKASMLSFLENITGINGLISDPYYTGGGLHETDAGGYLDVHTDFTLHSKLKLARRLNMIVFLNKDWKDEYGGHLELWDTEMKEKVISISPIYNRCVIFNTTHNSYHGQPGAVNCPENMSRRSIALYYYSLPDNISDLTYQTKWKSNMINTSNPLNGIIKLRSIFKKGKK